MDQIKNSSPSVKVIHYCWFGGKPLTKLAKKCLKSWQKYLPDYKIVRWDEKNFDVHVNNFCSEAYTQGKWAFVADVARCHVLREYGGLYFDTDMMVTHNIDDILTSEFAAGWESDYHVAAGIVWAAKPHNEIIEQLWNFYEATAFDMDNVYTFTIPALLTNILRKSYGLKYYVNSVQTLRDNTRIYPREYFYPISSDNLPEMYTENTCMVHYYLGSWLSRSERLRAEFKFKFGKEHGDVILDMLVSFKAALRSLGKVLFYPYFKSRNEKLNSAYIADQYNDISRQICQLSSPDYIAFYNKNWYGTSIATRELFKNTIGIEELHHTKLISRLAESIVNSGAKLLIFSAFAEGWDQLIREIHTVDHSVRIKILWHGSLALNVEKYDWAMFEQIIRLHETNEIESIGFVKKSLYEFFLKKGYRAEFIANCVTLSGHKPESSSCCKSSHINIGLYASGDRWVKNFYNQLAAASLFENATIHCIPLTGYASIMSKFFDFDLSGNYSPIKREALLNQLSKNDINFYATFTECAPLLPLESLELGVPCITGKNHHYWQGTPLEKYLVVDSVDDCIEIYNKALLCLEHRDEIIQLYQQWSKENRKLSQESVEHFLA